MRSPRAITAFAAAVAAAWATADDPPEFFGRPIIERRVLFVLDHSKSMLSRLDGQTRQERLREEVDTILGAMDAYHYVDIHCFNDRLVTFRRELVPCNDQNRAEALAFLSEQTPRGRTATYDALKSALVEGLEQGVQRIVFVTDGEPTTGTVVDPTQILARLRKQNERLDIPIDVLAFDTSRYPARRAFLKQLAADHDGEFVELD